MQLCPQLCFVISHACHLMAQHVSVLSEAVCHESHQFLSREQASILPSCPLCFSLGFELLVKLSKAIDQTSERHVAFVDVHNMDIEVYAKIASKTTHVQVSPRSIGGSQALTVRGVDMDYVFAAACDVCRWRVCSKCEVQHPVCKVKTFVSANHHNRVVPGVRLKQASHGRLPPSATCSLCRRSFKAQVALTDF